MLKAIITALPLFCLIGCGNLQQAQEQSTEQRLADLGLRQGEPVHSIPSQQISTWQYLNKTHISLSSGPGRDYLIAFNRPCSNLQQDNQLLFKDMLQELTRHAQIVSIAAGSDALHCPIAEIYRLEKIPKQ